jgi:hypothetical protein
MNNQEVCTIHRHERGVEKHLCRGIKPCKTKLMRNTNFIPHENHLFGQNCKHLRHENI